MASGFAAAAMGWGQRVDKIRTSVERGRSETLKKAGMAGKEAHNATIKRDSGGDMRLSGVNRAKGRKGNTRVGSRFDVRGDQVEFSATGPLQIIANDTAGRVIRSAYAKGRARKGFVGPVASGQFRGDRRAVIKIPGVGYRRSARHPGTKGKDTWREGAKTARTKVSRELHDVHTNIVRKAFG